MDQSRFQDAVDKFDRAIEIEAAVVVGDVAFEHLHPVAQFGDLLD